MMKRRINTSLTVSLMVIAPVAALLIFMLSMFALLSSQYQQSLMKAMEDQTEFFISHVDAATRFADEILLDISNQVYYDSTVTDLREKRELSNAEMIDGMRRLNSITATTSMIDSIYVYNGREDYIYSTRQYGAVSDSASLFKDREAAALLEGREEKNRLTLISRKEYTLPGYRTDEIYSFMYYEVKADGTPSESAVLLNLKSSSFSKLYFAGDMGGMTFITTGSGEEVSEASGIREDLKASIIKEILAAGKGPSGYLSVKEKGNDWICFYSAMHRKDWIFVKVMTKSEIMGSMLVTKKITYTLLSVLIILLVFLFVFITRSVYIPFIRVSKKIFSMNGNSTDDGIIKRIDTLIEERETSRSMSEKLKESMLRDILSADKSYDSPDLFLDRCTMRIAFACPVNVILTSFTPIRPLLSIVQDIIPYNECVVFSSDFIVFLLQPSCADDMKKLIETIREKLPLSFTVFSGEVKDWTLLPEVFTALRERWMLRFLSPDEKSVDITKEEERSHSITALSEKSAGIITLLKKGQKTKAEEEYREFVTLLKTRKYSTVRLSLLSFCSAVLKLTDESPKETENENLKFTELLNNTSDIAEIDAFFLDVFSRISQKFRDKAQTRHERGVQSIVDFIESDFRNPQLSTKYLSAKFDLSEAYLARVFRLAMGTSVQGYINRIRIEEAKRLLQENPKMKIKDLPGEIGIQNRQYFFKLFKSMTGKTPNEYQVDLEVIPAVRR